MRESTKAHGFTLMNIRRYKQIFEGIRGFPLDGRLKDFNEEITWMKRGNMLRKLEPLEKEMFSRSVKTLLNRDNGSLVIDDELISSRAGDVEQKTVSERKSGKEGPVSNCIACSFTSVLFGLRLRVKGESQQANVHALIDTLPSITTSEEKIRLIFDRGYGKMDFIEENARKRYNISTIATTLGSRHPFVTKKESDKYIQDYQAKGELSTED